MKTDLSIMADAPESVVVYQHVDVRDGSTHNEADQRNYVLSVKVNHYLLCTIS